MGKGFYQTLNLPTIRDHTRTVAECSKCKLDQSCKSPRMAVSGQGTRKILVIGEAPGRQEDYQGKPFVGESGQLLATALRRLGVDLRRHCWVTNAVICRPKGNKLPDKSIDYCQPNLIKAVRELQPEKILVLGATPAQSLFGWLWREEVGDKARWVGWQVPDQTINAWICPTYHPAYILRKRDKRYTPVCELLFEQHLKAFVELEGRPWPSGPPDYRSRVQVILDPEQAASKVKDFSYGSRPIAFDLETDGKKPDSPDLAIVSCAISDGKVTIAYPWCGSAVDATRELLESDVPKIAHNAKYEARWIHRKLGIWVRNWLWDTMIATHVLDNRKAICSLKFQSYVRLGADAYDTHIKPYLRSDGSNTRNRIREVPLQELLQYNGLDALLTWKLYQLQREDVDDRR